MLSQFADAINVVVIEDDPGDALIAEEYLAEESSGTFEVNWTKTLAQGIAAIGPSTDCVLLDLNLPDSAGVSALEAVRRAAPRVPIVVLTGLHDRAAGTKAVAAGAQDFLVKNELTPPTLARSIAYAMARAGVEDRDLQLLEADLRRQENQRLTLGLVPQLQVEDPQISCVSLYEPANGSSVLGGDFLDAIELPDGSLRLVLGDVAGHGPEEAALGVSLRVGWRTLVLSGCPVSDTFDHLDELLAAERSDPFTFATVCEMVVSPDRRSASVCLAGHPPPLVVSSAGAELLDLAPDTPLGVPGPGRTSHAIDLAADWTILMFSDGIFEGGDGAGGRTGLDAFVRAACDRLAGGPVTNAPLEALVADAEERHGGPLPDDVAMLACSHRPA